MKLPPIYCNIKEIFNIKGYPYKRIGIYFNKEETEGLEVYVTQKSKKYSYKQIGIMYWNTEKTNIDIYKEIIRLLGY